MQHTPDGGAGRNGTEIRPAATLLIVRQADQGIEVMMVKRSEQMRFLPGHVAFPGGAVGERDAEVAQTRCVGTLVAGSTADDAPFAVAALRECAEEIGWLCGLSDGRAACPDEVLSDEEQAALLADSEGFRTLLTARDAYVDVSHLRFVGRWVTPPTQPIRFDTRFFLYVSRMPFAEARVHAAELEWARWCKPGAILAALRQNQLKAVPPTIAMLQALAQTSTVEECFADLTVPGPVRELGL